MKSKYNEKAARREIDKNLEKAGWKVGVNLEKEHVVDEEGNRADYVLLGKKEHPLAVVEAKKVGKELYVALDQAKDYAKKLGCKFVYSSDGKDIWFGNLYTGEDRKVSKFHTQAELESFVKRQDPTINVYKGLPETLRYYQREAIMKIIEGFKQERKRMFLEMATGTGKTFTTAALIEELIQKRVFNRVLFLVDRDTLADQAINELRKLYQGRIAVNRLEGKGTDLKSQVLVSTVQKMYTDDTFMLYPPDFFDLVILDECHRSYYGEWHVILEHFKTAKKLGLTATPARLRDRDTYRYFGDPVYRYTYKQAVKDGFLSPCEIEVIRTNVDLEGLNWEGQDFSREDLEVKVNVPKRNRLIVREYKKRFGTPKKTLVFAVSIKHAAELARLFREEFGQESTAIITSDNKNARELIDKFRDPKSKLMIACTVEMLSTGFDAPCVEVLIMARPTKSRILYYQMKGRGCRLFEDKERGYKKEGFTILDFVDNVAHEFEDQIVTAKEIEGYDDVEEEIKKKRLIAKEARERYETREPVQRKLIVANVPVWVEQRELIKEEQQKLKDIFDSIGQQVEYAYSREMLKLKFKQAVKSWVYLMKNEDVSEDYLLEQGITLEELREAYNQPKATLQDFIEVVLEKREFPSVEELKQKAFKKWLDGEKLNDEQKEFLTLCYTLVSNRSVVNLSDLLKKSVINSFGGPRKIIKLFGSTDKLKDYFEKIKNFNYLEYL